MIIGYDARLIGTKRTGTVTMQQKLLEKLIVDNAHRWILFGDRDTIGKYEETHANVKVIHVSMKIKPIWEQFILPYHIFNEKIDLFYSTKNFTVPFVYRHRTIATILDLIPFHFPENYLKNKLRFIYHHVLLKNALKARAVVTISEFSRNDVLAIKHIENIHVIPLGPNASSGSKEQNIRIHMKPFFLTIGGAEPRKNIQSLLNAFSLFKEKGYPHKLVVVGQKNWRNDTLVVPPNIEKDIQFTGFVEDEELYKLYQEAVCFIFPSMYEGFGLPVLEAIYAGLPAIVASNSSLEEIYSDSCFMVETMDPTSYVRAMEELSEKETYEINQVKYNEIKSRYNWDNSANELMKVLLKYSKR
ncbi:hypothetical protein CD30_13730 [Ureibacillus massiliensis 4400831 = CIP 108448 = CCUG 49529]|uniref:Glycosyl transferase family 1 domain-containing protein n=1 Tax=Ureibacillus massiliensis 4400831 = CIP 108448 = CCUG 49529 TaxID=1211035 RepID=A0A0A3J4C2_9BACL|nr:glycosyltransferase family 1 protein [Ureibacillus massiliensis]KGR90033.1 hypothetical protein CD30_13730 [Ureibacillus massiliensis 4400831 = CIP 108448 = CCUG 49529]